MKSSAERSLAEVEPSFSHWPLPSKRSHLRQTPQFQAGSQELHHLISTHLRNNAQLIVMATTDHVPMERLEACWRVQDCASCLSSSGGRCGWCSSVGLALLFRATRGIQAHHACGVTTLYQR
jgi:hypothetical protein